MGSENCERCGGDGRLGEARIGGATFHLCLGCRKSHLRLCVDVTPSTDSYDVRRKADLAAGLEWLEGSKP